MLYFVVKAAISGLLIAAVSTIAKRSPSFGALVASLPLVSVLGMLWLWHDTHDPLRMQAHVYSTFWYVLPSLPLFLIVPGLMRGGMAFYPALVIGCMTTVVLYLAMTWAGPKIGPRF